MRNALKSRGRQLLVGWFWPLALLTLPMCALHDEGTGGRDERDPDPRPRPEAPAPLFEPGMSATSAVMCDIPIPPVEPGSDCPADATEAQNGMSKAFAAVALNEDEKDHVVFDFSDTTTCGGLPKKIVYHDPFPDGTIVCLNCDTQIPKVYGGFFEVCVAKCKDLTTADGLIPAQDVHEFCMANARVSTNFDKEHCSANFCSDGGNELPTPPFDSRRNPDDLVWMDPVGGAGAAGSTLSFPGPGTGDFSAGAASRQLITKGDGWVEFAAGELDVSHVVGLRTADCDPIEPDCHDTDGTLGDIPFGLSLNRDNAVYGIKDGEAFGPFGDPYTPGERFRIHVKDRNDGTADLIFYRLPAPCQPGFACNPTLIYYTFPGAGPSYPLRVDVTFREGYASLVDVKIMHIK